MSLLLMTMLLVLVGSASRAEASYFAVAKDPAGDSTSEHPGRDIIGAGIGFNPKTGLMVGVIQLRGAPTEGGEALITLYSGIRTPTGCDGFPVGGFGALSDSWDAIWVRQSGPTTAKHGEADKSGYKAAVQTFEARTKMLAGKRWNCLGANLSDPADPENIFDKITPVSFRGLPELSLKVPKVRRPIPVNHSRKVRIRISNPGDAPLRNVRVKIGRDRGVMVRPRSRLIKSIPARRHRAMTVRIKPNRASGRFAEVKVRARSQRLRASREIEFRVKHPRSKPSGGGSGGGGGGSVCAQYFPDFFGDTGGSLGLVPC